MSGIQLSRSESASRLIKGAFHPALSDCCHFLLFLARATRARFLLSSSQEDPGSPEGRPDPLSFTGLEPRLSLLASSVYTG